MGAFQRSPSKIWWADDSHNWSLLSSSTSPGSQDSGFSDAEISPAAQQQHNAHPQMLAKNASDVHNLSTNFKEKSSPRKNLIFHLSHQEQCRTPARQLNFQTRSEPTRKLPQQTHHASTISKRLFDLPDATQKSADSNQYSSGDHVNVESQSSHTDDSSSDIPDATETYPLATTSANRNRTTSATAIRRRSNGSFTRGHTLSESDSESELEALFRDSSSQPTFTSTPKNGKSPSNMRHVRNRRVSRLLKEQQNSKARENFKEEPPVVQHWLEEVKDLCAPECTTTLQCKSIAGDLAQKVAKITSTITASIRSVLSSADVIEKEYANIQSQNYYSGPLAQSFLRLIGEFSHSYLASDCLLGVCEKVRCSSSNANTLQLVVELYKQWKLSLRAQLATEVEQLVELLEEPQSELHLRATLTALSSLALREDLSLMFVASGAVANLCILCERCEGSTVRSLALRALSTICNNHQAIRYFERSSGMQMVADVLADGSRPEPERSEAVALLAQVTAPWIEDNKTVRGLQEYLETIVRSLADFAAKTNCCQNLLLCCAALANLSEMESISIRMILDSNAVGIVLNAIKDRGSRISAYILEQVAILLANIAAVREAQRTLIEENVPIFLLHFLVYNHQDEEVEKRLQQKSIIALSRLCSNQEAAEQVVDFDGVRRLVRLCRERGERHDSDAVLVAALATLRKISEVCGMAVIDSQDALELVEPRLLDSFLAYSAQNESYV